MGLKSSLCTFSRRAKIAADSFEISFMIEGIFLYPNILTALRRLSPAINSYFLSFVFLTKIG